MRPMTAMMNKWIPPCGTGSDRNIGAFIEVSNNSEILNWVAGVRVDTHNNLDLFVTPRFHLRYILPLKLPL